MKIEYLVDHQQYVETVATWVYNEFVKGIKQGITYDMIVDRFMKRGKDALPITIVAIENNCCIGTVSLLINDLKMREYTPWLAALYVEKESRKKGIGKVLIEQIQLIAKEHGYDTLYLRTEHASDYYKKLHWEHVEKLVDEFGIETDVFMKRCISL